MSRWSAVADFGIVFVCIHIFYFAVAGTDITNRLEEALPALGMFWSNIIIGLLMLGMVFLMLAARGQTWSDVGLGRTSWKRVAGGAAAAVPLCYAAVFAAVPLFMALMGISFRDMVEERSVFFEVVPDIPLYIVIPFSFFVGLHEETLFRGLLLGRLRAIVGSTPAAVVISALIFGALHAYQGAIGVVQTTAVALVFAAVAAKTRTIWPAIIAHGVFDSIGLAIIPLLRCEFQDILQELSTTTAPM